MRSVVIRNFKSMSRIGKQPIIISSGVTVDIEDSHNVVRVRGSKGELQKKFSMLLNIEKKEGEQSTIEITPNDKSNRQAKRLWGLTRTLISNMIRGVSEGFEKQLQIEGVGYRASVEGKNLALSLGFSHPVKVDAPEKIEFKVEKNIVTVSGIDKELVGQVAASIRSLRKPEPYKGKGIRYVGEVVKRKAGKKAVASGK